MPVRRGHNGTRVVKALAMAMALGGSWCVPEVRADEPATHSAEVGGPLDQFSQASEALYNRVAASLVHVRIDPTYATVLTPAERKDFLDWMRSQNADSSKTPAATEQAELTPATPATPREQRRQNRAGEGDGQLAAVARPNAALLFRKYVDLKIKDSSTDPVLLSRLRQAATRLQQPVGETIGVVIDNQGDALVLGGWVKDGAPGNLRVIAADGRELNGRLLGAHPGRGMAIIKIDSLGAAAPLTVADGGPAPGALLMCMTASTGGVGWITAPAQRGKKAGEESRFAVFGGEDRGATFLFNTKGELAAVGFERFALPMEVLKTDMQWIIENRKDVSPRQLGVKYQPVSPTLRKSLRVLANRPAVLVSDVAAGSPAERAGLKKDDIVVTIDRRPIWQMAQIQWDIATQTDSVPIGIVRGDHELVLDMPLADKN